MRDCTRSWPVNIAPRLRFRFRRGALVSRHRSPACKSETRDRRTMSSRAPALQKDRPDRIRDDGGGFGGAGRIRQQAGTGIRCAGSVRDGNRELLPHHGACQRGDDVRLRPRLQLLPLIKPTSARLTGRRGSRRYPTASAAAVACACCGPRATCDAPAAYNRRRRTRSPPHRRSRRAAYRSEPTCRAAPS